MMISPLATWFADAAAFTRFRRRHLGRAPVVLRARDRGWRDLAPGFAEARRLAAGGLPFHTVEHGRYDRSGDPRRLQRALAAGATVYLPQVHQVLPRLTRLMVALRVSLLGPCREECSFLFLVDGGGRRGMGLHHDGPVDAFWLQLDGRRTVTIGPPVRPGTPQDLDEGLVRRGPRRGWSTLELAPGTLFYLPPWTPHAVVCHGRSQALSLTWSPSRRRRRSPRAAAAALAQWDVVSGQARPRPRPRPGWLWTQVPVVAGPLEPRRRRFTLRTPEGQVWLPAAARPLARRLAAMPRLTRGEAPRSPDGLAALIACGVLADEDLPLRIRPDRPTALDGWRFG
jgi:hypothetical protein